MVVLLHCGERWRGLTHRQGLTQMRINQAYNNYETTLGHGGSE